MTGAPRTDSDLEAQLEALRRENVVLRSVLSRQLAPSSQRNAESHLGDRDAPAQRVPLTAHEAIQVTAASDREAFEALALELAEALQARYALIGLLTSPAGTHAMTLAVVADGKLQENFDYELEHTPCRDAVNGAICFYPGRVQEQFPRDALLREMGAEAYVGAPLHGTDGVGLGLIAALHGKPIDPARQPEAVIRVFADRAVALLERIRSEARLRESEERLRLALDASNQGTWDLDLRTGTATISDWAEPILGFAPDRAGESLDSLRARLHPEDLPAVDRALEACRDGSRSRFQVEFRARDDRSGWHWLECRALVRRDAEGRPARLLGTVMDITNRRERTRELLLHRFAIERAGEAMLRLDGEGRILDGNEAACRRLGYSRGELLGLCILDLEPGLSPSSWRRRWERVTASRHVVLETELRGRSGELLPVEMSASYLEFEGEEFCSVFVRDISERKRLEEQLLHSQKLEGIGRLAGGIAHDFNNLLTIVLGNLELAQDEVPPDSAAGQCIESAVQASKNAASLTGRLLAFARKQVGVPRILDLNESLGRILDALQRMVGERVQLVSELAPGLPPIRFDEGQLQQVLLNLAVNASDAMPEGGTLTVRTSLVPEPGGEKPAVRLEVRDTGHGIAPEAMPHLFEPFFTTKEPGQGTGLGLAMCHGIVVSHGGRIWAESEPGEGTRFLIDLPAVKEDVQEVEDAGATEQPAAGGDETVLLVEDDAEVRSMAERSLGRLGYRVLSAVDGEQAVAIGARHPGRIDLLLADVVLPGTSGKEVARRLQAVRPGLKVLFASGYADRLLGQDPEAQGAGAFLAKPFTPSSLGRKVREVLDS